MGRPMAENLRKAGFPLVVWNRTASKIQELVSQGARPAGSPRELAQSSDIVITMVTDSPDVERVILGPGGVAEGIRRDAVVIDISTISPRVTRELAARLQERGVHLLDAPVTGGKWGAQQGTLSIMVGGEREVYDRCLPVLQAMGRNIVYVGPSGAGQVAKLINQILVAVTLSGVAEALVFGTKAGVDIWSTLEAVKGGAAGSWQLENLGPRILKGDFEPGFKAGLQLKDLRLILEMARELQVPLPVTALVSQLYQALEAQGLGNQGTQAVVKALEQMARVEARAASPSPSH